MKNSIYLLALILHFSGIVPGLSQPTNYNDDLKKLPEHWVLDEQSLSTYAVTTTHYDYSMMGPFIQKKQISGEFTRGFKGNMVRWNKVKIAESTYLDAPFENGKIQAVMENFSYVPSVDMMKPEAFKTFPADINSYLLKNLVWDMMAFDAFSWAFTDSLSLNKEFRAANTSYEIDLAGQGTFENKDIRLTWIGITSKNQKTCAIIKYSVLNNPLKMNSEQLQLKGRSHYWGHVYVCLHTKQLEYAELYEDVIMDMKLAGFDSNQLLNTVRTIQVERIIPEVKTVSNGVLSDGKSSSHLRLGSGAIGF